MCEVNPEHKMNLCVENGVNILYLRLLKDLYGCMEYTLLWYDLYKKTLKSHESMVNTYDICIENSTIYGNQCTISWYFDINKAFHIDEDMHTRIIETISEYFGEFTVSREKKTSSWEYT